MPRSAGSSRTARSRSGSREPVFRGRESPGRVSSFQVSGSDEAELWTYTPVNGKEIATRQTPEIMGNRTSKRLGPGDTFMVIEKKQVGEVTYLRLSGGEGWLFDRMPNVGLMCTKRLQEVIEVRVTKGPSDRLGLDVGKSEDKRSLKVKAVKAGLIEEWNKANPQNTVEKGNLLVEINGVRDDPDKMRQQIEGASSIVLKVKRAASARAGEQTQERWGSPPAGPPPHRTLRKAPPPRPAARGGSPRPDGGESGEAGGLQHLNTAQIREGLQTTPDRFDLSWFLGFGILGLVYILVGLSVPDTCESYMTLTCMSLGGVDIVCAVVALSAGFHRMKMYRAEVHDALVERWANNPARAEEQREEKEASNNDKKCADVLRKGAAYLICLISRCYFPVWLSGIIQACKGTYKNCGISIPVYWVLFSIDLFIQCCVIGNSKREE